MIWVAAVLLSLTLGEARSLPIDTAPPVCGNSGYAAARALVPNPDTARSIFLAVEQAIFPGADRANYPLVEVVDEGGAWSVFRMRAPEPGRIQIGGGQLSLRIDKCDGTISDVYLSR